MKDLKNASARGVAWNLVQNLVSRILALVVVAILSRMVDRTAFGGVALALAITMFVELFVDQGYGQFITQRDKLEDEHLDTAFWFNVGLGALLTAGLAIAAGTLAAAFGEPSVTPVLQLLALSLVIRSFSVVPQGLLLRDLKFRVLSMRTVFAAAIGGAAGVIAAISGLGIYSLVLQFLVGDVVAVIVLWRASAWRPGRRVSATALRQLSAFGTPIIGATILSFASRRLDSIIVGGALGLATLGLYSMAQRVFQICVQVINKSTNDVAFSALSRMSESEDRRQRAFCRAIELTAVLCFPSYIGLAVVAEPVTVLLFGTHWADSAPVLEMFALSGVPFSLSLVHLAGIKSAAKTRYLFWINLTLLVVYLPLIVVLVHHGAIAAALASLIASLVIFPIEIVLLRAALSIDIAAYARSLAGGAIAVTVMGIVTFAVRCTAWQGLSSAAQVAVTIPIGIAVYIGALRLLAPSTFRRSLELAAAALGRNRPTS